MKIASIFVGIMLLVIFCFAVSDAGCAEQTALKNEYSLLPGDGEQPPEELYEEVDGIGIVINEIMADNDNTVTGPLGNFSDWIELYNTKTSQTDISGMYLTDDPDNPMKWEIPEGTVIGPGEYLIIWADGNDAQEGLHAPFRLDANGEAVALYTCDGEGLIDSVTYGKQLRDTSYGRIPDATGTWTHLRTPTPNSTNIQHSPYEEAPVWIVLAPLLIVTSALVLISGKTGRDSGG